MFFDSNDIFDKLKCSFCSTKFGDVVKLIPDCGNSICGACYQELKRGLSTDNRFKCRACNHQEHSILNGDLPNNNTVLRLTQVTPRKRALNEKSQSLCSSIDEIQEMIVKMSHVDRPKEIEAHCDGLRSEVMTVAQSAVQHLVAQQEELLAKIDQYRDELMQSQRDDVAASSNLHQDFKSFCATADEFCSDWRNYFRQIEVCLSDEEIRKALHEASELKRKGKEMEKRIKSDMMQNRVMVFRPNKPFFKSSNQLGIFDFLSDSGNSSTV